MNFSHREINPANPGNDRGKRTWEWKFPEGHQITVYYRKEGEQFGEHYHKGENPEKLLLIQGKMSAVFDADKTPEEIVFDATKNPVEITIFPLTLHSMTALTDCYYIGYRPTYFDPKNPDTYSP